MSSVDDDSKGAALLCAAQYQPVETTEDDGKEANAKEVGMPDLYAPLGATFQLCLVGKPKTQKAPPGISSELWTRFEEFQQKAMKTYHGFNWYPIFIFFAMRFLYSFVSQDMIESGMETLAAILSYGPAIVLFLHFVVYRMGRNSKRNAWRQHVEEFVEEERLAFEKCGYSISYDRGKRCGASIELTLTHHVEGVLDRMSGLKLDTSELLKLAGCDRKEIDRTKLTRDPTCPQLSVLYRAVILPQMRSVLKDYWKTKCPLVFAAVLPITILYVAMIVVLMDVDAPLWYASVVFGLAVAYLGVIWFLFWAFAGNVPPKSLRAMEEAAKSLPRFGKYRFVLRSKHHRWRSDTVYFEVVEDEGTDNGNDEGLLIIL